MGRGYQENWSKLGSGPKLFGGSCILALGLVGVRLNIGVRVSLGGPFRVRVRF